MDPAQQLARYKELLGSWGEKVNLAGPEALRNLDSHIAEAVAAVEILRPQGKVLDFGSGGGLPAIPMAIYAPEARFQLVEADQKKWAFLKYVVRECALSCLVHGDRLESLVSKLPPEETFDLITSRAVGHLGRWAEYLIPRLAPNGRLALFQTSTDTDIDSAIVPGLELESLEPLPRGARHRLAILRHVSRETT